MYNTNNAFLAPWRKPLTHGEGAAGARHKAEQEDVDQDDVVGCMSTACVVVAYGSERVLAHNEW